MNRCDECKHRHDCICVPYGCECFEIDIMDATTIKNCTDIELLENWESEAYRDCEDINYCARCFHKNENDLCDLELCTRRINELRKLEQLKGE